MSIIKREQLRERGIFYLTREEQLGPTSSLPKEPDELSRVVSEIHEKKLGEIKAEAEKIVEKAREQVKALREEAKRQGAEEGREEGRKALAGHLEEVLSLINEAALLKKRILRETEPEILRLALRVAEQILRSEVSLHRDVCLNIASEAIGRVSDREQIILKVNQEDVEAIKKYKDRMAGIVDGVKSFSIVPDSQVDPGGCVVETTLGYVDARLSTKLTLIEEAWRKVSEETPPPPEPAA